METPGKVVAEWPAKKKPNPTRYRYYVEAESGWGGYTLLGFHWMLGARLYAWFCRVEDNQPVRIIDMKED